jgi:hypothetical protein
MRTKKIFLIIPFLFVLIGMVSCEKDQDMVDGTIIYAFGIDNCDAYMIKVDNAYYVPDFLGKKYQIDGLKVKLSYELSGERHNCGFGGYRPVINIKKIRKL